MKRLGLSAACAATLLLLAPALAQQQQPQQQQPQQQPQGQQQPQEPQSSSDTYRQLDLFGEVFERVRADYVEQVSDQQLIEAAINGMLSSLDPHSSYMNA
ncbi:MAG TPA: peptidase S41, partial [Stellaceae bacterium]|nr:peptidase S41 [Stellaceae bacterium]